MIRKFIALAAFASLAIAAKDEPAEATEKIE